MKSNFKVTLKVLQKVILDGNLVGGTSLSELGEPIGAKYVAPALELEGFFKLKLS